MHAIKIQFGLSSMQFRAVIARLNTHSHTEAAEAMVLDETAFRMRFHRAIAKMPYGVRNRIRGMCPRRHGPMRTARGMSLSDTINI